MKELHKSPTGIMGLDEITQGGLPQGRPTLIAGNAGCGKTLMAMEFLIQGITQYNENGVFISFEEPVDDLKQNVASLGYDLGALMDSKKLRIDHVKVERSEIEETGEYDLEGLFIRLGYAIDSIHAKRVVLDTVESLFSGFMNTSILRAELRRLFQWLKDKGVTAIITGERGDASLTRQGLEEYVSDCVILLDHRVENQISTRRLRVVKYRGSVHGTNEYPFLIDEDGLTVMPVTSIKLEHAMSTKRISSGIPELDVMLGGGYYESSNVLISGTAGTGKTNLSTYFANASCSLGKRALFIAFEESPQQIIRNAKSIGLDIQKFTENGLLKFEATRATSQGLEMHLAKMYKLIRDFKPAVVIVDPISNLVASGSNTEVRTMLSRMMDLYKAENVTAMMTALTMGGGNTEETDFGVSSFVDSWLLLRDYEINGERNRLIYVLKSRGSSHSNQVREFVISHKGIRLIPAYLGSEGVLTGSARIAAEDRDKAEATLAVQRVESKQQQIKNERQIIQAEIAGLSAKLEMQDIELKTLLTNESSRLKTVASDRNNIINACMQGTK
jgi:circadian clock protein KaiC